MCPLVPSRPDRVRPRLPALPLSPQARLALDLARALSSKLDTAAAIAEQASPGQKSTRVDALCSTVRALSRPLSHSTTAHGLRLRPPVRAADSRNRVEAPLLSDATTLSC